MSKECCFCHKNEKIKNLLFEYHFAHIVWGYIHIALSIPQPHSISNMLGSWPRGFGRDLKPFSFARVVATCWSLWLYRNDLMFERNMLILLCKCYIRLSIGSTYMRCPPETYFVGFGCSSIAQQLM
jgi:hypothetical protein